MSVIKFICNANRWSCLNIQIAAASGRRIRPTSLIQQYRNVNITLRNKNRVSFNKPSAIETKLILDSKFHVAQDTLLFRHENARFFKLLNVFAMSQFFFWLYLSHFAFTMMRNIPVSEEIKNDKRIPWWRKYNLGQFKNGITFGCFMLGWGTMAISWIYTLRCVRYLILKKGGKSLMFVTFTPFGRQKYLNVPLENVSAKQSRMSAGSYLPIKVKGTYMYYILDMRGQFLDSKLFDYSAGLRRNWTK